MKIDPPAGHLGHGATPPAWFSGTQRWCNLGAFLSATCWSSPTWRDQPTILRRSEIVWARRAASGELRILCDSPAARIGPFQREDKSLINACTIIARNYVAHARVLAASLEEHNPGSVLRVLVVDDPNRDTESAPGLAPRNIEFVYPEDLDLDRNTFLEMAGTYGPLELCTAVKPWLLDRLLNYEASHALYLDPDIKIFGSLSEAAELAHKHGIVLTPHTLEPFPEDDKRPSRADIMSAGIYNLGFIGVGPESVDFLKWWSEHLLRDCIVDPGGSVFVDQRWIDLAPALFNACIYKDPSLNVAYWNLHERSLELGNKQFFAAGQPLTFFHFSGYDTNNAHLLSKHQHENPRILLSEHAAAKAICDQYGRDLKEHGHELASLQPYGFATTSDGVKIDHAMRRIYRDALKASDRGGTEVPPNPFTDLTGDFTNWLNEFAGEGMRPEVTRYLRGLWEMRVDLQQAYPDLTGPDAAAYLERARSSARSGDAIELALVPGVGGASSSTVPIWPAYARPDQLREGVNVAGYLNAELGIGVVARLALEALKAGGVECATAARKTHTHRHSATFASREAHFGDFDVNLVCVNADRFTEFAHSVGPNFFDSRYTIGLWWWEVAEMPPIYRQSFDLVDEIWCGSDHVRDAISRVTSKPVHKVILPLAMLGPSATTPDRRHGVKQSEFDFLFSFDFYSVVDRKNPRGLIDAYTSAFDSSDGTRLIIKTFGGDQHVSELESLKIYAEDRADIEFRDGYLDANTNIELMASADCYVSLHRAEGLGLTMAEAILADTPVIATGYSGNLEFTTSETAWLVPYTLVDIPAGSEPYMAGSKWAEPDLDAAARLMRHVFENPGEAKERARIARLRLLEGFSIEKAAASFSGRLDEIREMRAEARASERGDLDRGLDGLARAESYLERGPDIEVNSRFGEPGRLARKALLRSLRSYSLYQNEVDRGIIDAVAELENRLRDAELRSESQLDTMGSLQLELRALRSDLMAKIAGLNLALGEIGASLDQAKTDGDSPVRSAPDGAA